MSVACELCFHHCKLEEGQTGACRARACRDGAIVPLNYGKVTSLALDPIEKKPLRRFYPGSLILSVGSFGCNLRCPFCQNHEISMVGETDIQTVEVSPAQLAGKAAELRARENIGVAYTYNEPLVSYEYVRDCAGLVREQGMVNVLVTNGTIEEEPWRALLSLIDAANIDLKGFTPAWYRRLGGDLETVKRSIELAAEQCHVEVTILEVLIEFTLFLSVLLGRDYGLHTCRNRIGQNVICIITPTCQQNFCGNTLDQVDSFFTIRSGTFCNKDSDWHTIRIHGQQFIGIELWRQLRFLILSNISGATQTPKALKW